MFASMFEKKPRMIWHDMAISDTLRVNRVKTPLDHPGGPPCWKRTQGSPNPRQFFGGKPKARARHTCAERPFQEVVLAYPCLLEASKSLRSPLQFYKILYVQRSKSQLQSAGGLRRLAIPSQPSQNGSPHRAASLVGGFDPGIAVHRR